MRSCTAERVVQGMVLTVDLFEDGVRLWGLLQRPTLPELARPIPEFVELGPQSG
jgi:hypothetical protein